MPCFRKHTVYEVYILYLVCGLHATAVNLTFLLSYLLLMRDSMKTPMALEWYILFIYVPNLLAVVLIKLNALQLLPAL